jgi:hypothetical protein
MSSSSAQRLVDFTLHPYDKSTSKSKKRSSCFLYRKEKRSSPYGVKRALALFLLEEINFFDKYVKKAQREIISAQ